SSTDPARATARRVKVGAYLVVGHDRRWRWFLGVREVFRRDAPLDRPYPSAARGWCSARPGRPGHSTRRGPPAARRSSRAGRRRHEAKRSVAMMQHGVVIAGGGPTGLMLGGELALAGADVVIVERRESQDLA